MDVEPPSPSFISVTRSQHIAVGSIAQGPPCVGMFEIPFHLILCHPLVRQYQSTESTSHLAPLSLDLGA